MKNIIKNQILLLCFNTLKFSFVVEVEKLNTWHYVEGEGFESVTKVTSLNSFRPEMNHQTSLNITCGNFALDIAMMSHDVIEV